jgi:hypothetical protein
MNEWGRDITHNERCTATILVTVIVNKAIRVKAENDLTNLGSAQDASNCIHREID